MGKHRTTTSPSQEYAAVQAQAKLSESARAVAEAAVIAAEVVAKASMLAAQKVTEAARTAERDAKNTSDHIVDAIRDIHRRRGDDVL